MNKNNPWYIFFSKLGENSAKSGFDIKDVETFYPKLIVKAVNDGWNKFKEFTMKETKQNEN